MKRLLCLIGLHHWWVPCFVDSDRVVQPTRHEPLVCLRCGKEQPR